MTEDPANYLSAARRSARAAAAQAESERGGRMSGFSWGAAAASPAPAKAGSRKTFVWIALIVLLAIIAIAAGAVLSPEAVLEFLARRQHALPEGRCADPRHQRCRSLGR